MENTLEDYLVAIGYVIVSVIVFLILEKLILSKLEGMDTDNTTKIRLQAIANGVKKFISFPLMILVGIWLGSESLSLPPVLSDIIVYIVLAVTAYYLLQGSFSILDYSLKVTTDRTGQEHIVNFLRFILRGILIVILLLWFLSNVGMDITTFLAGFGIIGIGFAFALQNVIADLFASFTIYLDRPFEIGDTIKIGTDIGKVEKIGLKSTHIRTPHGNQLIVSNRELTTTRVHNMKRMDRRQVELNLGIHVDTPVEKLEEIPNIIENVVNQYENAEFKYCYFTEFGSSTLNYKTIYQITTADAMVWLKSQQSINLEILRKFDEDGIEMPYPIQKVVVENI